MSRSVLCCPGCGARLALLRGQVIRWLAPIEAADRRLAWIEVRCRECKRRWHFAPRSHRLTEVRP